MKTIRFLFAALAALALTGTALAGGEGWLDNYAKALEQAKAEKKLLFMEFTGSDWCPPCKKQAADVFAKQEFKDYAAKHLVLLELDFPKSKELKKAVKDQNADLHNKFGIRGFPTMVVLDGDGKELGRWVGYDGRGAATTIARLEAFKE